MKQTEGADEDLIDQRTRRRHYHDNLQFFSIITSKSNGPIPLDLQDRYTRPKRVHGPLAPLSVVEGGAAGSGVSLRSRGGASAEREAVPRADHIATMKAWSARNLNLNLVDSATLLLV